MTSFMRITTPTAGVTQDDTKLLNLFYGRIGGQEFTLMFDVMLQPATFANKPKQHAQNQGVY
jgi:hypothetical protein